MSDVRVVGLNMHTVLIADIGIDVPNRATVVIPSAKASKSKDLWRLINQKQLFRLGSGPMTTAPAPPPAPSPAEEQLREENRLLAEQNAILRQNLTNQGSKLDTILGLLESGAVGVPQQLTAARPPQVNHGVVDHGVPTFIPSEIKPRDVETHIEVQAETSEGSGVADAMAALRKLRRKA
jgi:hypothetical protein